MSHDSYLTRGGIAVHRSVQTIPYPGNTEGLAARIDRHRGVLLSSSFEFPGRYTRWDTGFADPPLALTSRGRSFSVEALNERGHVLIAALAPVLRALDAVDGIEERPDRIDGSIKPSTERFPEEQRSRQPSVFSVMRAFAELFGADDDAHLGLYGAFGYDLVFQFEPMDLQLPRAPDQRDVVLYLPDEILVVDHMRQDATLRRYDFEAAGREHRADCRAPPRNAPYVAARINDPAAAESDHRPGEYAAMVERAREAFARGDLFEAVLGQLLAAAVRRRSRARSSSACAGSILPRTAR